MTSNQLQYAYGLAVQQCLVAFYRMSQPEAKRLVDAWWQNLSRGTGIRSGMYLHSEALTTATDLARCEEVKVTDAVRQRYRQIVRESTRLALANTHASHRQSKRVELSKQMAG